MINPFESFNYGLFPVDIRQGLFLTVVGEIPKTQKQPQKPPILMIELVIVTLISIYAYQS